MMRNHRLNLTIAGAIGAALAAPSLLAQPSASPLINSPWRAYTTGDFPNMSPIAIASGDLDGDHDIDVVVAHEYYGGPGLVIMRNIGQGRFEIASRNDVPYGDNPGDVVLHDIDGDGHVDALATIPNQFSQGNQVYWWHGNSDGTFASPFHRVTVGRGPLGLVVADFTGDGHPDIVTADGDFYGTGTTVSLMVHNGQSGNQTAFAAPRTFSVAAGIQCVEAADLDGDTDLDLVVGRQNATGNAVMFNDGAGNFSAPVFYVHSGDTQYANSRIALTDIDRDGDVDLIASTATNGVPNRGIVSVRLNDGHGVFGPYATFPLPDWSWTVSSMSISDLNDDGWPDLICTTPSGRAFDGYNVLLNNRAGGFAGSTYWRAAKSTVDAIAFDADGDGDADVVTAANDSSVLTIHANDGAAVFPSAPQYAAGVLSNDMDQADIDHDGDFDIVTVDSQARILYNNGDGTFAPAVQYNPPFNPGSIQLRDMNGDGYADMVLGPDRNSPPYNFAVALNRGDGTFNPGVVTHVGASQAGVLDAVDLNHDTFRDVVMTDPGPASAIYVYRNTGDGTTFSFVRQLEGYRPLGIRAVDLNHDTHPDLLSSTSLGLSVWAGNGDFTFNQINTEGEAAYDFDLADFNGDGHLDLCTLRPENSFGTVEVTIMLGFGDGDFAFPTVYTAVTGREGSFRISSNCDAADIDGDGFMDLALTSNAPGDVAIFRGNGDGTLRDMDRYGLGYSAHASLFADFTGDGATDVAAIISLLPSGLSDAVAMLEGFGNSGGGLALSAAGPCPGTITLSADGATPGGTVAFIYAFGPGSVAIPSGPCAGTRLGLNGTATLLRTVRADGSGRATTSGNAPPGACSRVVIQALDAATCRTSNVEGI